MRTLTIAAKLSLISAVPATAWNYITPPHYCVAACNTVLDKVTFQVANKTEKGACAGLYAQSLFYCSATYCSKAEIDDGLHAYNETCMAEDDTPLPDFALPQSLSQVEKVTKKSVKTTNYTTAVIPDSSYFELGYKTTVSPSKTTNQRTRQPDPTTVCQVHNCDIGLGFCVGCLLHILQTYSNVF